MARQWSSGVVFDYCALVKGSVPWIIHLSSNTFTVTHRTDMFWLILASIRAFLRKTGSDKEEILPFYFFSHVPFLSILEALEGNSVTIVGLESRQYCCKYQFWLRPLSLSHRHEWYELSKTFPTEYNALNYSNFSLAELFIFHFSYQLDKVNHTKCSLQCPQELSALFTGNNMEKWCPSDQFEFEF